MSIQTHAKPENTKIREITSPRAKEMDSTKASPETTEIEISLPMLLVIIAALAGVIWAGIYFFGPKKTDATNPDKKQPETIQESLVDVTDVSLSGAMFKGNPDSKYVFLDLTDPECPACQYYSIGTAGTLSIEKQIVSRYVDSGVVRYAIAPYIANPTHKPAATEELVAVRCADEQGKAFDYLNEIFAQTYTNGGGVKGKGGSKDTLISLASTVGISNMKDFESCLNKHDIVRVDEIKQQLDKEVRDPWVNAKGNFFGTPAFVVCKVSDTDRTKCSGKAYVGAFSYTDMKSVIDDFLGADAPKN